MREKKTEKNVVTHLARLLIFNASLTTCSDDAIKNFIYVVIPK